MADYNNSKDGLGSVFPDRAIDGQEWNRVEPLITPRQLRRRHLFGIPLFSLYPDPVTGQRDELQDEDLVDLIQGAIANTELETGLNIFPVQYDEKHPFDMNFWNSYSYIKVEHRPVVSVEKFAFTLANDSDIYIVNPAWIEGANFHKGQINVIPMSPALGVSLSSSAATINGGAYLAIVQSTRWIPAYVKVTYTVGFPDGTIPRIVNDLIGINAALDILALLAATNKNTSYSLSIDGGSQSVSNPGPIVFKTRMDFLLDKKASLTKKIKNIYGLQVVSGYV